MNRQLPPTDMSRPDAVPTGSGDRLGQWTRTVTSSCYACNTPLTLTCERRAGVWVVFCTLCGVVRPPGNDLVRQLPKMFFS